MQTTRGVLLSVVLVFVLSVAAGGGAGGGAGAQPSPGGGGERVTIFVIDLSGSMKDPFPSGGTKLDVAKQAFATAFRNAVGRGGRIAIRTYGDQLPSRVPAERQQNCETDTRLAVPLSDLGTDVEAIIAGVNAFEWRGDTPVGLALRAAADDIPDGAEATVVLFSDGRDECHDADLDGDPAVGPSWGPDPCAVAETLKSSGVDVQTGVSKLSRIETIGFIPDQAAQTELQCIAEKTGGSYTAIEEQADLEQLEQLLVDLADPRGAPRLGGTPISGGATKATAPSFDDIASGEHLAVYADQLTPNQDRWFRAPTFDPGGGTFTATVFDLPAQEGITLTVSVAASDDENRPELDQTRENAGVPRAPSVSVRCPSCYWPDLDEPFDTYFNVRLDSEAPLAGTYDVELQLEGEAFGGPSIACEEPTECYYEGLVARYVAEERAADAEREKLSKDAADPDDVRRRDELREQVAGLQAQLADPARQVTTTTWWPLGLASVMAVGGIALGSNFVRRRPAGAADDELPPTPSGPETGFLGDGPAAQAGPTPSGSSTEGSIDLSPLTVVAPPSEQAAGRGASETGAHVEQPAGQDPTIGGWSDQPPDVDSEVPASQQVRESLEQTEVPLAHQHVEASAAAGQVEPGWYADPWRAAAWRWWDGARWTEHVR